MTPAQIDQLEALLGKRSHKVHWMDSLKDAPRRLYKVQRSYVDPKDGDDIPMDVAWLGNGQYIDLNNTAAHDIVTVRIAKVFE